MRQDRREFLGLAACAVGAAATGCASARVRAGKGPEPKEGDIRSLYLGLGNNMWCDWYPDGFDTSNIKEGLPDTKLRCNDAIWRQVTDHAAAKGVNQIVVDVGEGLVFPRRPELAIEGSWSAEKLADDVIGKLVQTCRKVVSPAHLKGFLMAPWTGGCVNEADRDEINRATDLLVAALS